MDNSLGEQGHRHLPQADMQVEGARALPTQVLIETEEFLNVPTIRKILSQGGHFRTRCGADEALKVILFRPFAGPLNVTVVRLAGKAAAWVKGFHGKCETGPVPGEALRRQGSIMMLESLGVTQGNQQVKIGVFSEVIRQLYGEVLNVGDDEGALAWFGIGENFLCQSEQFLGGGGEVASAAGVGQAKRLASFGIQEEKRLGLLGRQFVGLGTALDHVALGVT